MLFCLSIFIKLYRRRGRGRGEREEEGGGKETELEGEWGEFGPKGGVFGSGDVFREKVLLMREGEDGFALMMINLDHKAFI